MSTIIRMYCSVSALAFLTACGGGGVASTNSDTPASSGTFVNSPTKGIIYSASPSGLSGTTDVDGTYSYKAGDTVTFSLDLGATTITLGSTSNPSAYTSVLSLTVPNGGDPLAVAQVLETLDKSSVDGKMDVSGISLNAGAVVTAISNALKTTSVSPADIGTIASGVQAALSSAGSGTLKYGTTGVTQTIALTNLSKNPVNQSLVETKIQSINYDGSSTILDLQDKTVFTSWIIKKNGSTKYYSRLGVATSSLTFDYRAPFDATRDDRANGTYVLGNSNRDGTYTASGGDVGIFSVKTGEGGSYTQTYSNNTTGETGAISGKYLLPLALSDVKSKSYTIYKGCNNGTDNTVTINSSGIASATCKSDVEGSTWSDGPFSNTLQYKETNGTRHYIGMIRLDKKGGSGNLPSGAVGAFMNISPSNYAKQPDAISFQVN